jgi:hypothetical protein
MNNIKLSDDSSEESVINFLENIYDHRWQGLGELPNKLKTYKVCMLAVQENGYNLSSVPVDVVTLDMCKQAIFQTRGLHHTFEYIPDRFKIPEIYLLAEYPSTCFKLYPPKQVNYDFMLEMVSKIPGILNLVNSHMVDEVIVSRALSCSLDKAYPLIPLKLLTTKIVSDSLTVNGLLLKYTPAEFKNIDTCLKAVKSNGMSLEFVPDKYKTQMLVEQAIKENGRAFRYNPKEMKLSEETLSYVFYPNLEHLSKLEIEELYKQYSKKKEHVSELLENNKVDIEVGKLIKLFPELESKSVKCKYCDCFMFHKAMPRYGSRKKKYSCKQCSHIQDEHSNSCCECNNCNSIQVESSEENESNVTELVPVLNSIKHQVDKEQKTKPLNKGYVYILKKEGQNVYKIGRSIDYLTRINRLEVKLPFSVVPLMVFFSEQHKKAEDALHKFFLHKRLKGEWFELTQSDIDMFDNDNFRENILISECVQDNR